MNGDGRKDLLTSRYDGEEGELVWFEHPATDALGGNEWTAHVIVKGPDNQTFIETLAS